MVSTVNTTSGFVGDLINYIAKETLPLARRQLVAYQFATPATLPKGMGITYTATRFNRLPLPLAPLAEGVPPNGETMTISQVTAECQQWGDKVTISDRAELTIFHPLFKQALNVTALQISETCERNAYLTLMGGAAVDYVNQRSSRANLVSTDYLDTFTLNRMVATLMTLGAPRFMGDEQTDAKVNAQTGDNRASQAPRLHEHYVGIIHPLVMGDLRQNGTVVLAWSYSDINRLYNFAVGEWAGVAFCASNMVPYFTGAAAVSGAAGATTSGATLAASTTYYTQVTALNPINGYESTIYQIDAGTGTGSGGNNSLTLTLPSTPGFVYNVYIGTSSSALVNLAGTNSIYSPTTGPYAGMAVGLPPGATVVLTSVGSSQTPPAAPATGLTVFPTFVIGRDYYAMVNLDNTKMTYLTTADKSDPLNQLRIIGWKNFWGMLITNQQYGGRIEGVSAFSPNFDA
jgi:N4-gp56 family major capsid protein